MLTIQPLPRARMPGSAARMTESTAKKFSSNIARARRVVHALDRSVPAASGVVDQHVDAAEVLLGRAYRLLHLRRVGDIQRQDEHAVAVGLCPRLQLLRGAAR